MPAIPLAIYSAGWITDDTVPYATAIYSAGWITDTYTAPTPISDQSGAGLRLKPDGTNPREIRRAFQKANDIFWNIKREKAANLSGLSGATATFTDAIPAGAIVWGVTIRVDTAITGATSFQIGDGTDADRWGDAIGITLDTTTTSEDFTITSVPIYAAGADLVLTATGGNFTAGAISATVEYSKIEAPEERA